MSYPREVKRIARSALLTGVFLGFILGLITGGILW